MIEEEVTRHKDKLFRFGLKMQPLVIVVGDPMAPADTYVFVDGVKWKLTSPVKAVDVCYKAFHVLHAEYPAESHVWPLLQKLAYSMSTKWDITSTSVSAMLSEFH
jgi:hypothetical protein